LEVGSWKLGVIVAFSAPVSRAMARLKAAPPATPRAQSLRA
jgi:hypothetical protein